MLLAVGITIHNLPEGIAVGAGYMHAPQFGILIALAIMLHNIPEGIATALPLSNSGMGKWKAVRVALFSGLVEPIGAVVAALFLNTFGALVPAALAFAGGVMMFITLDELIPTAREHGHQHSTAVGIIFGSLFVFLTFWVAGSLGSVDAQPSRSGRQLAQNPVPCANRNRSGWRAAPAAGAGRG